MIKSKNILLGVCGSISAYKACELVRYLQKKGANVKVVMTPQATEFVGKITFQALTGEKVYVNWNDGETGLEHITVGRWADSFVVAPATGNTIAKVRLGIADDFLTSVALAYGKPIVFAPAMNTKMLENPSTLENVKVLKERGHIFVEPREGVLACGEEGSGKLAEIEDIYLEIVKSMTPQKLKGKKVLITAGGTREFFDPIRYISNASSGQMGYSLAKMAYAFGAKVVLVSAPSCLSIPSQIKKVDVVSALDMYHMVLEEAKDSDIIIMNAAVADFRPKVKSDQKLKKDRESLEVELQPNPDILAHLGKIKKNGQVLVGFAAESENILQGAMDKMKRKNLDCIVANPVDVFSKDTYTGVLILPERQFEISSESKEEAAFLIMKNLVENLT